MWKSTLLCMCVMSVWAGSNERESKLVKIAQGAVRGYKDPEYGIFAFQSIPYATAPTGPNRYKAPFPPPVWLQPLEAIDKGIVCPQAYFYRDIFPPGKTMQEDCLIANVYIPDTNDKNLPVMAFVHGGAFQFGFGDLMVGKKLVSEHNIIIVTFNYRLGINGFLCLGTEDVPGNAGMKDQVEALRWIKKNIANFGGNPDDITLAGASAGSASVDLLMLSKSTLGLFTKVIPESGANTAAFAVQSDPLQSAKNFAKRFNVTDTDDVYTLEQFYKTATLQELNIDGFFHLTDATFGFSPCVERSTAGAFIDESPVSILKNGHYKKLPLLYGFANMEGLIRLDFFDDWKLKMNEKFSDFLPADLKFNSEEEKEEVAKKIKEFYFGDKPIGDDSDSVLAYIDYFTDTLFAYATLRSTKLQVENGHDQIYLYEYSFVDEKTPVIPHTNVRGARHCAQSDAIIEETLPGISDHSNSTEEFKKMKITLRQIWANFIKTAKPVLSGSELPAWEAVRGDWAPHMSLGNELKLRGSLLERRARFWDGIYAVHYRHPAPPPAPPVRHTEL